MTTMKENWKPVTIGGVTGILMGAGTMFAVQSMTSDDDNAVVPSANNGLKVAHVSDQLSFRHAFEAARTEVGPGGVFTWRGHIYNTYTEAEWKQMSHDERNLFAARVKPEVSPADIDTRQVAQEAEAQEAEAQDEDMSVVAENTTKQVDTDDVRVAEPEIPDHDVAVHHDTHDASSTPASWNDLTSDDNDVRIVGFKEVEVGRGRSVTMQELDVNGQRVAVIDVDKDGDPDLAMTDLNHNHQMDEGEVIDLHTGEAITFSNDDYAANGIADIDLPTI